MSKLYGHSHLIALRGEQGYLCYQWLASERVSMLLFAQPKLANKWLKVANQHAELPKLQPVPVRELPTGLQAAINPADDVTDIRRIAMRFCYRG